MGDLTPSDQASCNVAQLLGTSDDWEGNVRPAFIEDFLQEHEELDAWLRERVGRPAVYGGCMWPSVLPGEMSMAFDEVTVEGFFPSAAGWPPEPHFEVPRIDVKPPELGEEIDEAKSVATEVTAKDGGRPKPLYTSEAQRRAKMLAPDSDSSDSEELLGASFSSETSRGVVDKQIPTSEPTGASAEKAVDPWLSSASRLWTSGRNLVVSRLQDVATSSPVGQETGGSEKSGQNTPEVPGLEDLDAFLAPREEKPQHPGALEAVDRLQAPVLVPPREEVDVDGPCLCPALAFCANVWIAALVEAVAMIDWEKPEHAPPLTGLCQNLVSLCKVFGPQFRSKVLEPQLFAAHKKVVRTTPSAGSSPIPESWELYRTLPVICRVVLPFWEPVDVIKWFVITALPPRMEPTSHGELEGRRPLDWATEQSLWRDMANKKERRELLLSQVVWPSIAGEFGEGTCVSVAHAMDFFIDVFEVDEVQNLAMPALFAIVGKAIAAENKDACTAMIKSALVALGHAWARVEQLGAEIEEKITVHFEELIESGGEVVAEAGTDVLGRIAASNVGPSTLGSVMAAVMRLATQDQYAEAKGVQASLARALLMLVKQPAIVAEQEGIEALRATSSVLVERSVLAEDSFADLRAQLGRAMAGLPQSQPV